MQKKNAEATEVIEQEAESEETKPADEKPEDAQSGADTKPVEQVVEE